MKGLEVIGNFIVPKRSERSPFRFETASVYAIIPTHKPGELTLRLVEDLIRWSPTVHIYVVDDCTPEEATESIRILTRIRSLGINVLRTPVNQLKAGALNYALSCIEAESADFKPDVIITLDDDVVIDSASIRNLVSELMSQEKLAAVCSQCRVLNKNKNLLTRLQGLEYVGFNAIRLADDGFFLGPLVMHGMLTAFKARALSDVGFFAQGHLIEDYEITARLKQNGWSVQSAVNVSAWTMVPEDFGAFWRQRTRWSYGGIMVVAKAKSVLSILQDLIGHVVFISSITLLTALLIFAGSGSVPQVIARSIIGLSLGQFCIWFTFQLWLMRLYREKDVYDWIIRLTILPELIYGNIMTLILLGSYLYFLFNVGRSPVHKESFLAHALTRIDNAFRVFGFSNSWGTK